MSDFTLPFRGSVHDEMSTHDGGGAATLRPHAPLRPETGTPLDRLLRRQGLPARAGGLLGFVPAQVR